MTIKPIQTRYKGYHFRSRLEARWAVLFDALFLPWEYEPEGFELPDGTRYLVDFWLPTLNGGTYVEVKGDSRDWDMCREAERKLQHICVGLQADAALVFAPGTGFRLTPTDENAAGFWCSPLDPILTSEHAIAAARSARFEFGQEGATA